MDSAKPTYEEIKAVLERAYTQIGEDLIDDEQGDLKIFCDGDQYCDGGCRKAYTKLHNALGTILERMGKE